MMRLVSVSSILLYGHIGLCLLYGCTRLITPFGSEELRVISWHLCHLHLNGNVCWRLSWFLEIWARSVTAQAVSTAVWYGVGLWLQIQLLTFTPSAPVSRLLPPSSLPFLPPRVHKAVAPANAKCRFLVQQWHWAAPPTSPSLCPPALYTQCINSALPLQSMLDT